MDNANLLSQITFSWASDIVMTGLSRPVVMDDVWNMRKQESCTYASEKLSSMWEHELKTKGPEKASFPIVALKYVKKILIVATLWKVGWLFFSMLSNVYLLREVIRFFSDPNASWNHGIGLIFGFFISECGRSICVNQHWLGSVLTGVRVRAAVRAMLYEKVLRLRGSTVVTGSAVTIAISDSARLIEALTFIVFIVSTPLTLATCLAIMLWIIGPPALAGFAVLLALTPLQTKLARKMGEFRREVTKITDERVRIMQE